jgi:hypothetical protein
MSILPDWLGDSGTIYVSANPSPAVTDLSYALHPPTVTDLEYQT